MAFAEIATSVLVLVGLAFFAAGTAGLLRFPDVYTRLHAMTKSDNVGLGFVVAGLAVQADSFGEVVELVAVWLLVMVASTTAAHLIAGLALAQGLEPWKEDA